MVEKMWEGRRVVGKWGRGNSGGPPRSQGVARGRRKVRGLEAAKRDGNLASCGLKPASLCLGQQGGRGDKNPWSKTNGQLLLEPRKPLASGTGWRAKKRRDAGRQ